MPANHHFDGALDENTGGLDRAAFDEALALLDRDRGRQPNPPLGGRIPHLGPDPANDDPDGDDFEHDR